MTKYRRFLRTWNNMPTKILAIDPGYERLGIAVLEKINDKENLIFSECYRTDSKKDFVDRLESIGLRVKEIIRLYKPETLAIETLIFNTNQKTAMRVSEVRGAIIFLAKEAGLLIRELTPLQIKMAITGYGRSDKKQMLAMLVKLIKIEKNRKTKDDEYDAIATGLACIAHFKIT